MSQGRMPPEMGNTMTPSLARGIQDSWSVSPAWSPTQQPQPPHQQQHPQDEGEKEEDGPDTSITIMTSSPIGGGSSNATVTPTTLRNTTAAASAFPDASDPGTAPTPVFASSTSSSSFTTIPSAAGSIKEVTVPDKPLPVVTFKRAERLQLKRLFQLQIAQERSKHNEVGGGSGRSSNSIDSDEDDVPRTTLHDHRGRATADPKVDLQLCDKEEFVELLIDEYTRYLQLRLWMTTGSTVPSHADNGRRSSNTNDDTAQPSTVLIPSYFISMMEKVHIEGQNRNAYERFCARNGPELLKATTNDDLPASMTKTELQGLYETTLWLYQQAFKELPSSKVYSVDTDDDNSKDVDEDDGAKAGTSSKQVLIWPQGVDDQRRPPSNYTNSSEEGNDESEIPIREIIPVIEESPSGGEGEEREGKGSSSSSVFEQQDSTSTHVVSSNIKVGKVLRISTSDFGSDTNGGDIKYPFESSTGSEVLKKRADERTTEEKLKDAQQHRSMLLDRVKECRVAAESRLYQLENSSDDLWQENISMFHSDIRNDDMGSDSESNGEKYEGIDPSKESSGTSSDEDQGEDSTFSNSFMDLRNELDLPSRSLLDASTEVFDLNIPGSKELSDSKVDLLATPNSKSQSVTPGPARARRGKTLLSLKSNTSSKKKVKAKTKVKVKVNASQPKKEQKVASRTSQRQKARLPMKEKNEEPTNEEPTVTTEQTGATPFSLPSTLYQEGDEDHLTDYQCQLRQNLVLFVANQNDVLASKSPGRNGMVQEGRVGIQCRFCAMNLDVLKKTKGAVYYASTIQGFYQVAQNMGRIHLLDRCQEIPRSIQKDLEKVRNHPASVRTTTGGKKYWTEAIRSMGCYEKNGGVWHSDKKGKKMVPPTTARESAALKNSNATSTNNRRKSSAAAAATASSSATTTGIDVSSTKRKRKPSAVAAAAAESRKVDSNKRKRKIPNTQRKIRKKVQRKSSDSSDEASSNGAQQESSNEVRNNAASLGTHSLVDFPFEVHGKTATSSSLDLADQMIDPYGEGLAGGLSFMDNVGGIPDLGHAPVDESFFSRDFDDWAELDNVPPAHINEVAAGPLNIRNAEKEIEVLDVHSSLQGANSGNTITRSREDAGFKEPPLEQSDHFAPIVPNLSSTDEDDPIVDSKTQRKEDLESDVSRIESDLGRIGEHQTAESNSFSNGLTNDRDVTGDKSWLTGTGLSPLNVHRDPFVESSAVSPSTVLSTTANDDDLRIGDL